MQLSLYLFINSSHVLSLIFWELFNLASVSLLASDGSTVGENDDGPDGTTNSLLVVSIFKTGIYTVRVRASNKAKKAVGPFTIFVTH